jgi:hypothetical protein
MEFTNYWFSTGTPTFLIKMIQRDGIDKIDGLFISEPMFEESFKSYDPAMFNVSKLPLLFQTGYLTIKSIIRDGEETRYILGMPNYEVRKSFSNGILTACAGNAFDTVQILSIKIRSAIDNCRADILTQELTALFAQIPYDLHIDKEAYYHSLFLLLFTMLGFEVIGELHTNRGRIDAVLELGKKAIITEIKYSKSASVKALTDNALKQIKDKKYYESFLSKFSGKSAGKQIIFMGIGFRTGKGREKLRLGCKINVMNPKKTRIN